MHQFILVLEPNFPPLSQSEYHYHTVHVCHVAEYETSGRNSKQPMKKDLILSPYLTHTNATKNNLSQLTLVLP